MTGPDDLHSLRTRMDALNAKLIATLHERAALSREIGRCKRDAELPVRDATREQDELRAALATVPRDGCPGDSLRRILEEVFAASRALVEAPDA